MSHGTQAEEQVYPLATPEGKDIPFDVGDPIGLFITAFTTGASAEKTLPTGFQIGVLYSTADMVIAFGTGVTLNLTPDVEKVDHQFVPAGTPVSIHFPASAFKTIGVATSGTLYIQGYRRWKALSQEVQQTRII